MKNAPRAAVQIGFATFTIFSILCLFVIVNNPNRALAFAHIGTRFSEQDPQGTTGYDGQFVYFIARHGAGAVPYMDGPTLRYQRILYPLLGRVLAFGVAEAVPWTLILVNLIAHSAATGLLAYLLAQFGASPYFALVYTFWLGNIFAIRFDLNEPLCFALALAAILTYRRENYLWSVVLLMFATLAKELGLIIAAGLALHAVLSRGKARWSILIFGGPLLLFLTWWGVMRLWFGRLPLGYPAAKLHRIPFEGLFADKINSSFDFVMLAVFLAIPTALLLTVALYTTWKQRQISLSAALLLPAAGFVMTMPDVSWADPVAAYRVAVPIVVTGLLLLGESYPRALRWLAALWLPASIIPFLIPQLWF